MVWHDGPLSLKFKFQVMHYPFSNQKLSFIVDLLFTYAVNNDSG